MKQFQTINDILDFAINAEQEAVDFYTGLASDSKNAQMKVVFTEFAAEEMKHKSRLTAIKDNQSFVLEEEKVKDLRIADYLTNVVASSQMTYADALVLAMKKEKDAFRLYMMLSQVAEDSRMKEIFLSLAQEEAKHKLRFEIEYDEFILREN
jgi:rubrerythrin